MKNVGKTHEIFLHKKGCLSTNGGYIEVKPQYFEQIPIPIISEENKSVLTLLTQEIIWKTANRQKLRKKLIKLLQGKYPDIRITKKIENWFDLKYNEFKKELSKQSIRFSLSEESEWIEYFEEQIRQHSSFTREIFELEKEIDRMVYELYGLTEEEIGIVESGSKWNGNLY